MENLDEVVEAIAKLPKDDRAYLYGILKALAVLAANACLVIRIGWLAMAIPPDGPREDDA